MAVIAGSGGLYPRQLSTWVPAGWDLLADDGALSGACFSAWHQGVLMTPLFPSYALVAFCGAIETISQAKGLKEQVKLCPRRVSVMRTRRQEPCPLLGHRGVVHARKSK